ncbi:zinc finger, A20-type transcription factor [Mucor lusitanicus]|uniref:Zinc finger, A20-type transcription factor n=2 Tax=Mucor circinelloides f. lusitanicus TaxID=29924 RepID=A0A168GNU0_MUCCL|nr:zinc finger, A20-type transcription factor [Mucor lusitanicus]OAC97882.1 zinc finger, A20-type transcription factor [Mucor lusitanicus CBS 277.49]
MENTNSSSTTKAPTLCTAGCGFYGSEAFNNMCSQCFKAQNKSDNTSAAPAIAIAATTADKIKALPQITKTKTSSPPKSTPSTPTFNDNASIPIAAGKSRKHLRSPSPSGPRMSSAPASSIASPVPSSTTSSSSTTDTTSAETNPSDKPVQLNKGRCFKCRSKVPLAKQAANKCRCSYVFCDSHRYPDRHDCDIDYAKMDREILAKNNPKLLTRRRYQEI